MVSPKFCGSKSNTPLAKFHGSKENRRVQNTHTPHGGRAGKTAMKMARQRRGGKR